jgi:hypothetical protein
VSTHIRLKAAAATAVLAGLLAAPAALPASASASAAAPARVSSREAAAIRAALLRSHDEENPIAGIISELQFDVSPGNIAAILEELPGFPPYGSLF